MKKITVLFLMIFTIVQTHAQDYQISFAGSGASTLVDSVIVENLTQCTSIKIKGNDILHLYASVGINEINDRKDNAIQIFPNPMTGVCTIDFESSEKGMTTLELYDLSGKRILKDYELLSKGHHIYSLNGIRSGVYILKIASDKFSYSAKIISSNTTFGTNELKHIGTTPYIDFQNTTSNSENLMSLKNASSIINMQYKTGDRLKLTGKSGVYRTISMLVPTKTQTVSFNFIACTDVDNNNYSILKIGAQVWMAENLKVLHYRNGNPITNVTGVTAWRDLTTEAYCDYDNIQSNSTIYGKLYNWFAVIDSRNICPIGWHVPTYSEWTTMLNSLGGEYNAGGKLKDVCSSLWISPNTDASNETGYTALPSGFRSFNGSFFNIKENSFIWSSTVDDATNAWSVYIYYKDRNAIRSSSTKTNGFVVRCIKD